VTIINSEVRTLRPVGHIFSIRRLGHIQNDRHSVLVIVALNSLVSVGRVGTNEAMGFGGELCFFKVA